MQYIEKIKSNLVLITIFDKKVIVDGINRRSYVAEKKINDSEDTFRNY